MKTEVIISESPLKADAILEKVTVPESGGIDMFVGTVRNHTKGKQVKYLEYEAYEPMALKELNKIAKQAHEKWELHKLVVHHRVGHLDICDKAVVIAVSSAHRPEAFEACRFVIEEIKKTVPIWKKEFFEDGEHWVSATP